MPGILGEGAAIVFFGFGWAVIKFRETSQQIVGLRVRGKRDLPLLNHRPRGVDLAVDKQTVGIRLTDFRPLVRMVDQQAIELGQNPGQRAGLGLSEQCFAVNSLMVNSQLCGALEMPAHVVKMSSLAFQTSPQEFGLRIVVIQMHGSLRPAPRALIVPSSQSLSSTLLGPPCQPVPGPCERGESHQPEQRDDQQTFRSSSYPHLRPPIRGAVPKCLRLQATVTTDEKARDCFVLSRCERYP